MKVPMQRLMAELAVEKGESGERTATLKWYTGSTVTRRSWDGTYLLTLSMKPSHVRMDRLKSGKAPLLNSHSDYSLSDVIGVIESADLEGNAKVRFSNRAEVDPIWQDVQDGIIRNASVGAAIYKLKDLTEKDGNGNPIGTQQFEAIDWEPMEVSLVPIGADPNAGFSVQFDESKSFDAEVVSESINGAIPARMEEVQMKETPTNAGEETRSNEQAAKESEKLAQEQARKDGEAKERARVMCINETVKALGLRQSLANEHIDKGTNIEIFRELAIKAKSEEEKANLAAGKPILPPNSGVMRDEMDKRVVNLTGALLERFKPGGFSYNEREGFKFHKDQRQQVFEGSRQYVGMSLLDMAKDCLENIGTRWKSMDKSKIVALAFQSTSDFPLILADSANKSLRAGYGMAESPWRLIAARRSAADFKTQYELTIDSSSRLEQVPESGEFKRGALIEGRESYAVKTYGKIMAITRQAIINDDLGAFTRVPFLMGQEVAMLEAETVVGLLNTNGNLSDGVALFEKNTHLNYDDSAAAIAVDTIGALRAKLRVQTGPGGKKLGLIPRYIVVPPLKEQLALQYTATGLYPAQASNVNVWAGTLTPVVLPQLTDDNDWYLFCDPESAGGTVLVYAYLEGLEGPYTETQNGWNADGTELKVRLDFGAGAVDYRGAAKKAGS
jgi:phage major head subunit gpT-like protein